MIVAALFAFYFLTFTKHLKNVELVFGVALVEGHESLLNAQDRNVKAVPAV